MGDRAMNEGTNATVGGEGGGAVSRLVRRLIMLAIIFGAIAAARQWALNKSDQQFERRLRDADRQRN